MKNHQAFVQTWFERVWNNPDPNAIDELFPAGGTAEGLGGEQPIDPEGFKQFHGALLNLLKDIHISIHQCVEQGEWASALCSLEAVSRADSTAVKITGTVFCRIKDGKMLEAYNHWDFVTLWEQLGILPPNTIERGLAGESIA